MNKYKYKYTYNKYKNNNIMLRRLFKNLKPYIKNDKYSYTYTYKY